MAPIAFTMGKTDTCRYGLTVLAALLFTLSFASCAPGKRLATEETTPVEVSGNYRLLLFGCRYPDDIQNAVFLDKADDPYIMEIYAPDFEYTIKSDVPGDDALRQAEEFLRCSFHYEQAQLSRIFDPQGNVIGYEMKPLYSAVRFGMRDVMNIEYRVRENKAIIYIKLDPRVEAIINDQGGDQDRNRGKQ